MSSPDGEEGNIEEPSIARVDWSKGKQRSGDPDADGKTRDEGRTPDPTDDQSFVPRGPRVRWRSSPEFSYRVPRAPGPTDERGERQKAQRNDATHLSGAPYAHESADITDTSLAERTAQRAPPPQRDETTTEKAEEEVKLRFAAPVNAARSLRDRIMAAVESWADKGRQLATRLGRPEEGGDDLQSAVYHPEWAAGGDIPLSDMTDDKHKTDDDRRQHQKTSHSEAHRLVRELTQSQATRRQNARGKPFPHQGQTTTGGQNDISLQGGLRYRSGGGGVLSHLMKLNTAQDVPRQPGKSRSMGGTPTDSSTATPSGATTPRKDKPKWYKKHPGVSAASSAAASGGISGSSTPVASEILSAASKRQGNRKDRGGMSLEEEIRVTVHIAEIIARQRYIMQLCKALMKFGAPTHRLEEYMQMTAKVLEVDSQYLYLPGCMIMSFDDSSTRTTEVKLVRVAQGIDLARLADTHSVYKNVVHDVIGVEEAIQELTEIMNRKPKFNKWMMVLAFGLASATVGPFAFNARPIDMPIIFVNGSLVGFMQHVLARNSVLYSNVFEVTASILTSFLARAFGSISSSTVDGKPQYIFCFSAIAQSSIALILPGFLVLCSSLELQSHQIIAGSIRIVYAIIYSLFLGYGITVGTTIYGLMDAKATSAIGCPAKGAFTNPYVQRFPFVALLAVWLIIINQGKWKQAPTMIVIALAGYVCNYFSTKRLGANSQVANTVGAFAVGVLGNLYSRVWHGHAATAILPAIFVLVPSGLAATGSLISGVQSANEIRGNVTAGAHGTSQPGAGLTSSGSLFSLGIGMIQVAIGITVGLFIAALVVYPYGKRRSGLFSF